MKIINNKGFTLVELLAVIVILGVIMLIAIPSVGTIIQNSRKKSFISTGNVYMSTMKNLMLSNGYTENDGISYCADVSTLAGQVDTGEIDESGNPIMRNKDLSPFNNVPITGVYVYSYEDDRYEGRITDGENIAAIYGDSSQSFLENPDEFGDWEDELENVNNLSCELLYNENPNTLVILN